MIDLNSIVSGAVGGGVATIGSSFVNWILNHTVYRNLDKMIQKKNENKHL